MAYTTIDDPSAYFQTTLYTGDGGGTRAVTHGGNSDLNADWVWIKDRGTTSTHYIFDSVRGVQKHLTSSATTQELSDANSLKAFNSNSFTLGTSGNVNGNTRTFVSWNWKAGTSVSGTTTGGTGKAYSGSVNTDAGISLITYLGNDNSAHVIPHHLGVAPELTIIKERSNADIWVVQNSHLGFGNYMTLQTTSASASNGGNFITAVSSSTVTMNENAVNNANDQAYMLYSFASKQGYSKVGTYVANGNTANNTFVYTGFKVGWVLIKRTSSAGEGWFIFDSTRSPANLNVNELRADVDTAETTGSHWIDFLSNGFKPKTNGAGIGGSGDTYIYMAFAENPFVTSTGVPTTAR